MRNGDRLRARPSDRRSAGRCAGACLALIVVAGCGSPGFDLARPVDIFENANGSAALAEPPSSAFEDYLPSASREAALGENGSTRRVSPNVIVDASVSKVEPAFGLDNVDTAEGGKPITWDETQEDDFRIVRMTLAVNDVVAGDAKVGSEVCVLMSLGDARASLGDLESLAKVSDVMWFPLGRLDQWAGALAPSRGEIVQGYADDGCFTLIGNSILVPSPKGDSVEWLGPWQATITTAGGRSLGDSNRSIDDLENTARQLST